MRWDISLRRVASALITILLILNLGVEIRSADTNFWNQRQRTMALLAHLPDFEGRSTASFHHNIPPPERTLPSRLPPMLVIDPTKDKTEDAFSHLLESLSVKYGAIRKISSAKSTSEKSVFIIEDAHLGIDAQKNFQMAIQELLREKKGGLAAGEEDAGKWGLNSKVPSKPTPDKKAESKRDLALIKNHFAKFKSKIFNKKLEAFDLKVQMFHQGSMSMGSYIQLLTHMKEKPSATPTTYPYIDLFRQAMRLESNIDFPTVEKHRAQLITELLKRMGKPHAQEFMKMCLSYRRGNVKHLEFYSYLNTQCVREKIPLANYPAMRDYIQYVRFSSHMDADKLFIELQLLEDRRYASLIIKPAERELVRQSILVNRIGKLLDSSRSSEEWLDYKKGKRRNTITNSPT